MENINTLKLPFDKIFCLNLAERPDRREFMENQFKNLGILDQITWHTAVKHPNGSLIAAAHRNSNRGYLKTENEYSCSREHYTMIKSSYLMGYDHILILEDDISLINDLNLLSRYMNNVPEDYDFLRICAYWDSDHISRGSLLGPDDLWNLDYHSFWGTGGYALSRAGMIHILQVQDDFYQQADMPLYDTSKIKNSGLKMYTSKIPMALHEDTIILKSDIQPEYGDTNLIRDPRYGNLPLNYNLYGCM